MVQGKQPSTGELVDALKKKWAPFAAILAAVFAGVAAYNSKASSSDLDAVKTLLVTQDKNTAVLQSRLDDLARLRDDISQLRQRVDNVSDRAFGTPAVTTASTKTDAGP